MCSLGHGLEILEKLIRGSDLSKTRLRMLDDENHMEVQAAMSQACKPAVSCDCGSARFPEQAALSVSPEAMPASKDLPSLLILIVDLDQKSTTQAIVPPCPRPHLRQILASIPSALSSLLPCRHVTSPSPSVSGKCAPSAGAASMRLLVGSNSSGCWGLMIMPTHAGRAELCPQSPLADGVASSCTQSKVPSDVG